MNNRTCLRVIAADDDPTVAILLSAVLRAPDFALSFACDGETAWQAIAEGGLFDIALLDVEMPAPDGLALAAMLRQRFADRICIVLMTGREDPAFLATLRELDAKYLPKPVDWKHLPQALRDWAGSV